MSSSINGKEFKQILKSKLSRDSSLLKDSANLFTFTACVFSGEPISISNLISLILKASGSALSATMSLMNSLFDEYSLIGEKLKDPQEKFRLIFYLHIQQSYF